MKLCHRCRGECVDNKSRCLRCIEIDKLIKEERKKNGLCIKCGKIKINGICAFCTEYRRNRKKRLLAQKLCGHCGKDSNGKGLCIGCAQHAKDRRRRLKLKNMCVMCGTNPANKNQKWCIICSSKQKDKHKIRVDNGLCIRCDNCVIPGKKYCAQHIKERNIYDIQIRRKIKLTVFKHYGNKCSMCGINDLNLLTIDHINNDGKEHRKRCGASNYIYRDIIKNHFPPDLRLLCWKCQKIAYLKSILCHSDNINSIYQRRYYTKLKLRAMIVCGGPKCLHCGETDIRTLEFDHIYGGGGKHHESLKNTKEMYMYALKHPEKFQILCANCNHLKCLNENNYASIT